jgi:preprotein translocase subunit SecF
MEFFSPNIRINFMKYRAISVSVSGLLMVLSAAAFFWPGPNYGVDFRGGTELQLAFKGKVDPGTLRQTLEKLGYDRPDVVAVEGQKNQYIIRVSDVSALTTAKEAEVEKSLPGKFSGVTVESVKWSPGGDKVSLDLSGPVDTATISAALESAGVKVRTVSQFGQTNDSRYEAQLVGVSDKLVSDLQTALGEKGPDAPLRAEWVGPKAGAQLRDGAIQSLIYAILFIMVYVAFRFDLRFAPGGVIALIHDALLTGGFVILVGLEFNLQTVAALLTIVGFSINDTIVTFDRIRENMGRLKDASLAELINISTSQMLSRTIITSGTAILSLGAFLIWGTPLIREMSLTLIVGFIIGVYSSVYVAAPITEWMDRKFFRRIAA